MQLYVWSDINARPLLKSAVDKYISIKQGRYVNNIEYCHLPKHIIDELDDYQKDDIKNHRIYIVYINRAYYQLDVCNVSPEKSDKYFS